MLLILSNSNTVQLPNIAHNRFHNVIHSNARSQRENDRLQGPSAPIRHSPTRLLGLQLHIRPGPLPLQRRLSTHNNHLSRLHAHEQHRRGF